MTSKPVGLNAQPVAIAKQEDIGQGFLLVDANAMGLKPTAATKTPSASISLPALAFAKPASALLDLSKTLTHAIAGARPKPVLLTSSGATTAVRVRVLNVSRLPVQT